MYINNKPTQTSSFWKIYRELQRNVQPLTQELHRKNTIHSLSFDLPSCQMLKKGTKKQANQNRRIIKSPSIMAQFGIPTTRVSKMERAYFLDVISQASIELEEDQIIKKVKFRRASQYEYMSNKQKRLNGMVPHTEIYQHSHEAGIVKKKKINRLRNQYKFLQRSKQRRNFGEKQSKSCPLMRKEPKITHKRAKTVAEQQNLGVILPIDFELQRKIALLCFRQRDALLMFRRKTCIQQPRLSLLVSKEKLLTFQEALSKKFGKKQSYIESGGCSSPIPAEKLQLKKEFFKKLSTQDNLPKQFLTPRSHNEQSSNIIQRKSSFNIIGKWIADKSKMLKHPSSKQQLPLVQQPTLEEMNQYFLSSKKNDHLIINSKVSTQLLLTKSAQCIVQQEHKIKQAGNADIKHLDFSKLLSVTSQQSQQPSLSHRIRTLPSDHSSTGHRSKILLQQKLKPYFQ